MKVIGVIRYAQEVSWKCQLCHRHIPDFFLFSLFLGYTKAKTCSYVPYVGAITPSDQPNNLSSFTSMSFPGLVGNFTMLGTLPQEEIAVSDVQKDLSWMLT